MADSSTAQTPASLPATTPLQPNSAQNSNPNSNPNPNLNASPASANPAKPAAIQDKPVEPQAGSGTTEPKEPETLFSYSLKIKIGTLEFSNLKGDFLKTPIIRLRTRQVSEIDFCLNDTGMFESSASAAPDKAMDASGSANAIAATAANGGIQSGQPSGGSMPSSSPSSSPAATPAPSANPASTPATPATNPVVPSSTSGGTQSKPATQDKPTPEGMGTGADAQTQAAESTASGDLWSRIKANEGAEVQVELGFPPNVHNVLVGKAYRIGRRLPDGIIVEVVDQSAVLAASTGGGVTTPAPNAAFTANSGMGTDQASIVNAIVAECLKQGITQPHQIAFMLAVANGETHFRHAAYNDEGGRFGRYGGRGLAQMTGVSNYQKFGERLGLDLENNPDLAARPDVSVHIFVSGIREGWTSRGGLQRWFPTPNSDTRAAYRNIQGGVWRDAYDRYYQQWLGQVGNLIAQAQQQPPGTAGTAGSGGTNASTTPAQTPAQTPTQTPTQAGVQMQQQAGTTAQGTPPQATTPPIGQTAQAEGLRFDNQSQQATGNAGTAAIATSATVANAQANAMTGQVTIASGNTIRTVGAGQGESTGVILDWNEHRTSFIRSPIITKKTPLQLQGGYGALTVQNWSANDKQMIGATVVTPAPDMPHPTGVISAPAWGTIRLGDRIPGTRYTWNDATHNGSRPPESPAITEGFIAIARFLEQWSTEFMGASGRFRINSWYRPPRINRQFASGPNGPHTTGTAVDINFPQMGAFHARMRETWPGGVAIRPGSFVHIDLLGVPIASGGSSFAADRRGRARWRY